MRLSFYYCATFTFLSDVIGISVDKKVKYKIFPPHCNLAIGLQQVAPITVAAVLHDNYFVSAF